MQQWSARATETKREQAGWGQGGSTLSRLEKPPRVQAAWLNRSLNALKSPLRLSLSLPLSFPFLFSPFLPFSSLFFPSPPPFHIFWIHFWSDLGLLFHPSIFTFSISILIAFSDSFGVRFLNHVNHQSIEIQLENIVFPAFRPFHTWSNSCIFIISSASIAASILFYRCFTQMKLKKAA